MRAALKINSVLAKQGALRPSPWLRSAVLLFALAAPALVHAQFQSPSEEELKMTADPKAPGAAAVYLYREDITDDAKSFRSYHERIKVLTEKGKELATIRIPYVQGTDIPTDLQGRTIHSDGTIVPLTAKPADLMDYKTGDYQVNNLVFTLPSVEVGSVLEYRLKVRTPSDQVSAPTWDIQQAYFVHKAHYSFHHDLTDYSAVTDSKGHEYHELLYTTQLGFGAGVHIDKDRNLFTIDLTDIPPMPDEDWMPPLNTVKWRVEFYYTEAESGPGFWDQAGAHWAHEVQAFTNPTGGLKKAVAGIVAPGDSDEQKARKIYDAVQKLDNTDFSRKKSDAERKTEKLKDVHKADDVWKQQSGSANEIALLYIALARVAGLRVFPFQVVNRDRALFDSGYLSTEQLDDNLAVVEIDGKEVYLDPGQKMCPYGSLHWKHTFASGFRLTHKGTITSSTPGGAVESQFVQRVADLTIDPDGGVKGTIRVVMSGPDALYWRQLALENDPEEVKKQFNESMRAYLPDGVAAGFDHFLALDDPNVNLIGIVQVTGNIGSATGKHFFLPGLFFESRTTHPFVGEDMRHTPIDLQYAKIEQDHVTYHLPSGFTVQSTPKTADFSWPAHTSLKISSTVNNGTVEVVRNFARSFATLDAVDYSDLHDFYLRLATADQQQIVLTRDIAPKGN